MKKFITNRITLAFLGFLLLIAIWFIISACFGSNTMIFPSPITTFQYFGYLLTREYTYQCLGSTALKVLIGYAIGFAIALIIGVIVGNFMVMKKVFNPTVATLKCIPTATLVFAILIFAGAKWTPVYIVVLITSPIVYEAVVAGISNVPTSIIDAAKDYTGNFWTINWKIKLPLALPYIGVGIAASFSMAFKIEIMAEVLSGDTTYGIGSAIAMSQRTDPSNMVPVFAYSLIAIILSFIVTGVAYLVKNGFNKSVKAIQSQNKKASYQA